MSKLALHGSVAGWLLWPVLFDGAFGAVLVIGERRVQVFLAVSLPAVRHGVSSIWVGKRINPVL
jgi:hypothetical protein